MFLGQLIAFIQAFWKKYKLMKGIRFGKKVYLGNREDGKFRLSWNDVYIGILVLLLMYYFVAMDHMGLIVINAIIVGGTFGFAILMNKIRPERDTNIVLQIGFTLVLLFTLIMSMVISISDDGTDLEVKKDNVPVQISDYRETQDEVRDISYYHEGNVFGNTDKYFVYGKQESLRYYVYRSAYSVILDKVWEDIISGKKYNEDVYLSEEQIDIILDKLELR